MCGIVGYVGDRKAVPIILEGLKRLEYRGYDSAGLAVYCEDKTLNVRRASGKLRNLEQAIREDPVDGSYGIGHTRWATHGRPTEENAHPHRDCTGDIVVVHNGIVENYLSLKQQLQHEGHQFKTETDTEVIAHLVEKYFQGNLEEAVRAAVKELIQQPRIAAERADIAVYNAGAPAGSATRAADALKRVGLLVSTIDVGTRVAASRIEAGAGARQTAALIVQTLGLPADALVVDGESSTVRVLLGPDAQAPHVRGQAAAYASPT